MKLLKAVNSTIDESAWDDALVSKVFAFALHIDPSTPLPDGDENRFEQVIEKVCLVRYKSLNCLLDMNLSPPPSIVDLSFFGLVGSTVTFKPQRKTATLPGGDSMQWALKDPDSLMCTAMAAAFKGCSQSVASLFDGAEEKWGRRWARPGA